MVDVPKQTVTVTEAYHNTHSYHQAYEVTIQVVYTGDDLAPDY
jgi:hypothetical protein